jgi:excisionase family DNA binding protein
VSPEIDLSGWMNADQVCTSLGIAPRTLDREVAANRWQTRLRQRPGKRPERVFDPEEVAGRLPSPPTQLVHVPPIPPMSPPVAQLAQSQEPPISRMEIAAMMQAMLASLQPEEKPTHVRIKEASRITGFSVTFIRRAIRDGRLPSVKDGGFKMRRETLETFDPTAPAPKKKAHR